MDVWNTAVLLVKIKTKTSATMNINNTAQLYRILAEEGLRYIFTPQETLLRTTLLNGRNREPETLLHLNRGLEGWER